LSFRFAAALFSFALVLASCIPSAVVAAETSDWPWWRGPSRDGVAPSGQDPPLTWSETENVVWKAPIPGKGHASPTIVGDRIYLATSVDEEERRSVLCLDRATGKILWDSPVHVGKAVLPKNDKGSQASSTVACDGERLFVNFAHDDAVFTSALALDGEVLWQTRITDYVDHQGYGSSPAIFGPLVIVSADSKEVGGAVAGLDRATGKIVWRHDRPKTPNYPSPIILDVAGRTQMFLTGCDLVSSFDPLTGEKLWEMEGATTECVTSTVTDGKLIYSTGGYPRNHVAAYAADGSKKVVWDNGQRVYVPSMLIKDGYLYAVADAGVAICWKADTGEEIWKERIGGTYYSSPVLVDDRIYVTDESGKSIVFRATPDGFEPLGESRLGDACYATPAIVDSRIYARVIEEQNGKRQEVLYCLGSE
jgi:hypothetical protein